MSNEPIEGLVTVHKRERTSSQEDEKSADLLASSTKKRKFKIVANDRQPLQQLSPDSMPSSKVDIEPSAPQSLKELMALVRIIFDIIFYRCGVSGK